MSLVTNIVCKIKATESVAGDLGTGVSEFADRADIGLATGTGASQADKKWSDTRTVGTSGETLDLTSLTDSLGRTINFVKVKAIHIRPSSANSSTIIVGNAASNQVLMGLSAATATYTLAAQDVFMRAGPVAGYATASANNLKVVGGAAGQIYDIEIIGTSA